MTRIFGFLLAALALAPLSAAAGDLTLRDVMELHRTGLGDDLLIAVIDADGGPFRLSFVDIQDLKSDGLSERVIAALVRTGARQPLLEDVGPVVEPVAVYQEVVTYVPSLVVVGTPVVPVWRDENHVRAPRPPRRSVPPRSTASRHMGDTARGWQERPRDGSRSIDCATRDLGDPSRPTAERGLPAGAARPTPR